MSVPEWLKALGIPEECISGTTSAAEKGRSFSIRHEEGDQIWRVHVDNCWVKDNNEKRVDYLFWGESATGHKVVILVELKGKQFGKALEQVEVTLERLCKKADGRGIHNGNNHLPLKHDQLNRRGVRVYVILSKGEQVTQHQIDLRRIQKKYGIVVRHTSVRLEVNGLDKLP